MNARSFFFAKQNAAPRPKARGGAAVRRRTMPCAAAKFCTGGGAHTLYGMNVLFVAVFCAAGAAVAMTDPAAFLPALLRGGEKAAGLCLALAAVYAVWLGILRVAEDAGLLTALSRGMRPLTRRLFGTDDEQALGHIAVNLSANLLGMGGAATPAGVAAMRRLGERGTPYARAMLFAVNCAGFQLLPATVVALRAQAGAQDAYSVFWPVFLAGLCALAANVFLVWLAYGLRARRARGRAGAEVSRPQADRGGGGA